MVDEVRLLRLFRSISDDLAVLHAEASADPGWRADPLWLRGLKSDPGGGCGQERLSASLYRASRVGSGAAPNGAGSAGLGAVGRQRVMGQAPRELTPWRSAVHFFGAQVRCWRTLRRLSQATLGMKTHDSSALIGKIEKGERYPSLS